MKRAKIFISFLLSGIFLYLAFRGLSFEKLKLALSEFQLIYALPALLLLVIEMSIRALRWKLILDQPEHRVGYIYVWQSMWLCYYFNYIFPARAGELIRCHVLNSDDPELSRSRIFGTVILERTLDGICLVTLLLLSILWVPQIDSQIKMAAGLSFLLYFSVALTLVFLYFWEERVLKLLKFLLQPFPSLFQQKFLEVVSLVTSGFQNVANPTQMAKIFLVNSVLWGVMIGSHCIWLTGGQLQVDNLLSLTAIYLSLASVGMMIPSAPGALGTYHFFASKALLLFGVAQEKALVVPVLIHGFPYLTVIVFGTIIFIYKGLKTEQIMSEAVS